MKKIKKHSDKSFEEVLKELDDMIIEDMKKFKDHLNRMSIRENTDGFFEQEIGLIEEFENSENMSNLAEHEPSREELYYV